MRSLIHPRAGMRVDQVARYTKAADQARLARNAMTKAIIR